MRIGIDLSFIRPDHKNGGTEAAIKNLIKGLEEIKAMGEIEDEFLYFIHRDIYKDYRKIFPELSYRIYDIKGPHALRTIGFQTFHLPRLVREEKLDLLYFPTFQTGLKGRWNLPLVVNPNDIQYKYYPEYFSFLKRCYYQIFYKNALKKADKVVVISRYVGGSYKKYFKRSVKGKLSLIYAPIDFKEIREEEVDALKDFSGEFVLCINSLTKHKNLITLVKAFHMLVENPAVSDSLKLVIAGAKWNGANEITDYIEDNRLQERIVLTGFLTDGQLQYLYHHARVFVTPSLYEGFGMTPIEAMAAGCPVISSKETSLYEVTMGKTAYYEPAKDETALYGAMLKFLSGSRDLKGEMEETLAENKKAVLRYGKEKIARQYMELFYETAEKSHKMLKNDNKVKERREMEVYGKLFDVVSENAAKSGKPLECVKESFVASTGSAPREIDLLPFLKLEKKNFADALWLAFFQKLPDVQREKNFGKMSREAILKEASREGAFAVRGLKPVNSPYGKIKPGIKGNVLQAAVKVKNSIFLRKLAKSMPAGIQNKIRDLFC